MKVTKIEKTARGEEITVVRRVFLFFKLTSLYIKKNGEYYADYGTFGIDKLKNKDLSERIDDKADVYRNFYCA